ncbi:MAG: TRAP transporter small permease subunit, partial [Verrucomicrobia bacterium]|nr:TRAP transporter small permease subunit [Verrucomicrobiota bacterium]
MKSAIDGYYRLLKWVLTFLMTLIILPVALQILSRYTGLIPRYIWTEEVARFCFVWIIMIGAMIAV